MEFSSVNFIHLFRPNYSCNPAGGPIVDNKSKRRVIYTVEETCI